MLISYKKGPQNLGTEVLVSFFKWPEVQKKKFLPMQEIYDFCVLKK